MAERRYSEREFALILKHAAELQEGLSSAPRGEFTLSEIQNIAAAAGIDAQNVLDAARALPTRERAATGLRGPASRYEFSDYMPGEIEQGGIEEIIDAARSEAAEDGEVTQVLDSVEWRARDAHRTLVVVTRRSGRTRLKVVLDGSGQETMITTAGLFIGTVGTLAVVRAIGLDGPAGIVTVLAAGAVTTYAAITATWRIVAGNIEARGRRLFEKLANAASMTLRP
ncbi:MAG: hypothetical protein ACRENP_29175 [Longimicrobiales bacterium]